MHRSWLLVGVFGALGTLGCAFWRQPAPLDTTVRVPEGAASQLDVATQAALPSFPAVESQGAMPTVLIRNVPTEIKPEEARINSTPEEPSPEDDPLTRFAESLKSGDTIAAAKHLETYVRRHPDQVMFRLQLGELLIKASCDSRARVHYEQFVAEAQVADEPVRKYLVQAHTRLMEIGQRENDFFAELFHRGVGLLILVQEQDNKMDRDDRFCEEMLCKSLRALKEARDLKPADQRVHVYLAEVYERMGNHRASANERSAARNGVVSGVLTPLEKTLVTLRGL